jgi:hypothetical protein
MKQGLSVAVLVGSVALACGGTKASFDDVPGSQHLRLEVACSSDAECPATFECESEAEHGVTSTFCSSTEEVSSTGTGGAKCPPGYEVEKEHGISFCRSHGGKDAEAQGSGGRSASDDSHHGSDDDAAGGTDDAAERDADDGMGGSDDGAEHDAGDDDGAGGSDDGAGHDAGDDDGAGGSDDGAGHDAHDDSGSDGKQDGDDSHHGKGGK